MDSVGATPSQPTKYDVLEAFYALKTSYKKR